MRIIFFLLLFINLAFAVYIQLEPNTSSSSSRFAKPGAEKMTPAAAVPEEPATCLEWGSFVAAELADVEAAIAKHQLNGKLVRRSMGMVPFYWVHIPPLQNKEHAVRKMGELDRRGITKHTHVQDDDKWNNAISLGFFEKIEDARAFLVELRHKTVRSAIIGARNMEQVKFVINPPFSTEADVEWEMAKLKEEFPGSVLMQATCEKRPAVLNTKPSDQNNG
jgi:hypothetical protein